MTQKAGKGNHQKIQKQEEQAKKTQYDTRPKCKHISNFRTCKWSKNAD